MRVTQEIKTIIDEHVTLSEELIGMLKALAALPLIVMALFVLDRCA